jgi:hypothetical protein
MRTPRSLLVVDRFAPEARRLRRVFDERFEDPRVARARRARFAMEVRQAARGVAHDAADRVRTEE